MSPREAKVHTQGHTAGWSQLRAGIHFFWLSGWGMADGSEGASLETVWGKHATLKQCSLAPGALLLPPPFPYQGLLVETYSGLKLTSILCLLSALILSFILSQIYSNSCMYCCCFLMGKRFTNLFQIQRRSLSEAVPNAKANSKNADNAREGFIFNYLKYVSK